MAAELARISELTRLASLQQASMTPQALQLSRHARRVYVGNLPHNTTESSLTHYFNQVRQLRWSWTVVCMQGCWLLFEHPLGCLCCCVCF